ncbi:Calcineurin-like phosphoesterase [Sphingopyxis sp. YR583]|uniref:metallophosphoesterase n=1 Tax=Sphingopyxis sp. YR583 TaxID=1881047 RepID=UPI0008A7E6A4|nr:metallophosphoesterase [Sphingopyxis sp. YR583]SEH13022.1 Calcineurin-like phosphoesterase [Sphingopyxis sp. YR583]
MIPPFRMALGALLAVLLGAAIPVSALAQDDGGAPPAIGPEGDGPYVAPGKGGWTARSITADRTAASRAIGKHGKVEIAAVGKVPAFRVGLRAPSGAPAPDRISLAPDAKLLVLADTHGEYEILVEFLQAQGVIGKKLEWRFGKGQMVVTGDMFDRGAHQLEILWLFYKLEGEARKAGGALHVLLGNHEAMVLRGDLRYLHPRYGEVARILGARDYAALFTPETLLGNWLRSRPAVLKLGDLLFLHGGISPAILDAKLDVPALNAGIRGPLAVPASETKAMEPGLQLIAGSLGPQWYRGYFAKGESRTSDADVERTLAAFGVAKILVGHTVVEKVTPLYGGKVIAVQVYPARDKASGAPILEGALREKGRWFRLTADGARAPLS